MIERGLLRDLHTCEECDGRLKPVVVERGGGFLVVTSCGCGPYSTETGLFAERDDATRALKRLTGQPVAPRSSNRRVRSTRSKREYRDLIGEYKARRLAA